MTKSKALFLSSLALASAVACGSGDPSSETGMVVGLHAELEHEGEPIRSNEFELELVSNSIVDSNLSARAQPSASARIVSASSPSQARNEATSSIDQEVERASDVLAISNAACKLQPDTLQTFDGMTCWTAITTSVGSLATERRITRIAYLAPDGIYHAIIDSSAINASTDLVSTGVSSGTGCVASPTGDTIEVAYLASLLGIGISTSFGFNTLGVSTFYNEEGGLQRAYQYDSGFAAGISLLPFSSFSFSMEQASSYVIPPTRIDGGACDSQATGDEQSVFAGKTGNAFEIIAAGLSELRDGPKSSYRDLMLSESASAALPTFQMLANSTGSKPEEGLPATNHADLSGDFLSRGGSTLCSNCVDTSLDGFLYRFREDIAAADGETATRSAVQSAFAQYNASTPDALRFSVTQRRGASSLRFAELAHGDLAAELRGDQNRYVQAEIVDIEGEAGKPIALRIEAKEIADLIGVDAQAVEGATLTFDGSPRLEPITFTLVDGAVELEITTESSDPFVIVVDVNLTTAVGPFAEAPTTSWVVRPAVRRLSAKAGPPAFVSLSAPARAKASSPVTMTAFVTDAHHAPVTSALPVRFYDAENQLLGEAPVVDGTAQLAKALQVSQAHIESVEATTLTRGDAQFPGFFVTGTGFSKNAHVFVNGRALEPDAFAILNAKELIFSDELQLLGIGAHSLIVENPDGHRSSSVSFQREQSSDE